VEQQLAAGLAERQIAELVDDDEIVAQQLLGQPAAAAGGLFLFQLIETSRDWTQPSRIGSPAARVTGRSTRRISTESLHDGATFAVCWRPIDLSSFKSRFQPKFPPSGAPIVSEPSD